MPKLTPTQQATLKAAADRPDKLIYPIMSATGKPLSGGPAKKVTAALINGTFADSTGRITDNGYQAIGLEPPRPKTDDLVETDSPGINLEAIAAKVRAGSKMELVVTMLLAEGGATGPEIAKATGWAAHTIRGFIAGTIKKKLGLEVAASRGSITDDDGKKKFFSTYRITG